MSVECGAWELNKQQKWHEPTLQCTVDRSSFYPRCYQFPFWKEKLKGSIDFTRKYFHYLHILLIWLMICRTKDLSLAWVFSLGLKITQWALTWCILYLSKLACDFTYIYLFLLILIILYLSWMSPKMIFLYLSE